jgi:hypothetical protein
MEQLNTWPFGFAWIFTVLTRNSIETFYCNQVEYKMKTIKTSEDIGLEINIGKSQYNC